MEPTLNVGDMTINAALIQTVEIESFTMGSVPEPIKIIHIYMSDGVNIEIRVIQGEDYPTVISSASFSCTTAIDEEELERLMEWLSINGHS
jgi:hypothetical protein